MTYSDILHYFLCAIPAVCGAYIGVRKAACYSRRAEILREYISVLTELKIHIRGGQPLYQISAFRKIAGDIRQGDDFFPEWERSLRGETDLTESDFDIMLNLGANLGKTDAKGQYDIIDGAKTLLKKNADDAEKTAKVKGGVLRRSGALIGLLVSILLL